MRMNGRLGGKLSYLLVLFLSFGSLAEGQMPAPEPLVVTVVTADTVALAWNDIYTNEDGFVLTRSDNI